MHGLRVQRLLLRRDTEVAFAGVPIKGPRRDVAVVFQDYSKALLPWRTAAGNVALALEATGTPRAARPGRIGQLLTRVGLDVAIELPRPRNQVSTRESPEFLKLRRTLYDFIHASETAGRS